MEGQQLGVLEVGQTGRAERQGEHPTAEGTVDPTLEGLADGEADEPADLDEQEEDGQGDDEGQGGALDGPALDHPGDEDAGHDADADLGRRPSRRR